MAHHAQNLVVPVAPERPRARVDAESDTEQDGVGPAHRRNHGSEVHGPGRDDCAHGDHKQRSRECELSPGEQPVASPGHVCP